MWGNGVKGRSVDSPSGEHRGNHPHEWWIEGEIILEATGNSFRQAEMGTEQHLQLFTYFVGEVQQDVIHSFLLLEDLQVGV